MVQQGYALFKKDWLIEWRTKWLFSMMLVITFLLFFTFSLALEGSKGVKESVIWVVLIIVTAQISQRHLAKEKLNSAWEGIQLAPIDLGLVFFVKWLVMCLFVFLSYIVIVPLYIVFFDIKTIDFLLFLFTLMTATAGMMAIAITMSILTIHTQLSEFLILLLEIPLLIPLLIGEIQVSKYILYGGEQFPLLWMILIVGFTLLFVVVPMLLLSLVEEV
jgi:heme exporter protein B